MRALIVDHGRDRASLAATRGLHADGWTVGNGAPFCGITGSSRACAMRHVVPPAEDGADAYVAAINAAIAEGRYELVMSSEDTGVFALSQSRDRIDAVVPYPDHAVLLRVVDKLQLARAARLAGLATPIVVEADDTAIATTKLPAVVKAAVQVNLSDHGPSRLATRLALTAEELVTFVAEIQAAGATPLLQEVVSGRLMAYSFVADRAGSIVAAVAQESVHIWPPAIGDNVRARTVPIDPGLATGVARLVDEVGWFGMAQLEFVRTPGCEPYLIDWNPRPYGSLALAVAAGVNLPAICARLATSRRLNPVVPPRTGVTFQWFPRDLKASIAESGKVHGASDALITALGATHALWRRDDPWPAVRHYAARPLQTALSNLRRHARTSGSDC